MDNQLSKIIKLFPANDFYNILLISFLNSDSSPIFSKTLTTIERIKSSSTGH
jgi:hypothetical protein